MCVWGSARATHTESGHVLEPNPGGPPALGIQRSGPPSDALLQVLAASSARPAAVPSIQSWFAAIALLQVATPLAALAPVNLFFPPCSNALRRASSGTPPSEPESDEPESPDASVGYAGCHFGLRPGAVAQLATVRLVLVLVLLVLVLVLVLGEEEIKS